MMYARLVDGYPQFAPKKVKYNRRWIYNPPAEILLELGYLPVEITPYPDLEPAEGYYWAETWYQDENLIWNEWDEEPLPEE